MYSLLQPSHSAACSPCTFHKDRLYVVLLNEPPLRGEECDYNTLSPGAWAWYRRRLQIRLLWKIFGV